MVAEAHLRLGRIVVADCMSPVAAAQAAWRAVARAAGIPLSNVGLVCSDAAEHRRRARSREAGIQGLVPPDREAIRHSAFPWDGPWPVLDPAADRACDGFACQHLAPAAH